MNEINEETYSGDYTNEDGSQAGVTQRFKPIDLVRSGLPQFFTVKKYLGKKKGVSQKNGKEWSRADFIIVDDFRELQISEYDFTATKPIKSFIGLVGKKIKLSPKDDKKAYLDVLD